MNRECNSKRNCPDDNDPLTNFSSEDPDRDIVFATQTQNFMPPPLGSNFTTSNCFAIGEGETQEEAAGNALSSVIDCIASHGLVPPTQILPDPPGTPPENRDPNVFQNADQLCTALCSDGLPFTFIVPAGRFTAFSQREADEMAVSYACSNVLAARLCIGSINPPECCLNETFSATITATKPAQFSVYSGNLPTGLALSQVNATTARISGIPTALGQFQFALRATDSNGGYMQKAFQMITVGIITSSIPSVQALIPYSVTFTGSTVSFGTMVWALVSGTLPAGLSFDPANQTLSGTPTESGTFNFTLQMSDGIVSCRKTYALTVTPCIAFSPALAGALHWYDASQLSYTNGQQIGLWPNAISGNTPFGGPASANYPFFMTGMLNGLPIVRWVTPNPGGQNMTARNIGNSADIANFCSGLSCMDIFVVASDTDGSGGRTMIESSMIAPGSGGFRLTFNGASAPPNQFQVDFKRTNGSVTIVTKKGAVTPVTGEFNIFHVKLFWQNATCDININGTNYLLNNATGETTGTSEHNTQSYIPDDTSPTGVDIAEIIIFPNNLSLSDIDKAFGYLAYKWGLRSKLPANHPYKNSIPCSS